MLFSICTTVLLFILFFPPLYLSLSFFGRGIDKGMVLAWRCVQEGNGVGPMDKTSPLFSRLTSTLGPQCLPREAQGKKIEQPMISLKLLVSYQRRDRLG